MRIIGNCLAPDGSNSPTQDIRPRFQLHARNPRLSGRNRMAWIGIL